MGSLPWPDALPRPRPFGNIKSTRSIIPGPATSWPRLLPLSRGVGAVRRCPPQGYRMGGLQVAMLSCVQAAPSSTSPSSCLAESPAWSRRAPGKARGLRGWDPSWLGRSTLQCPAPGQSRLSAAHIMVTAWMTPPRLCYPQSAPEPWAWGFSQKDRQARLGGLQSTVPAELGLMLAWLPSISRGQRASPVGRKEPLCPVGCNTKDHLSPAPTFVPAHLPWTQPELLLYLPLRVHSSPL